MTEDERKTKKVSEYFHVDTFLQVKMQTVFRVLNNSYMK